MSKYTESFLKGRSNKEQTTEETKTLKEKAVSFFDKLFR